MKSKSIMVLASFMGVISMFIIGNIQLWNKNSVGTSIAIAGQLFFLFLMIALIKYVAEDRESDRTQGGIE